jgi:hypothetical protein
VDGDLATPTDGEAGAFEDVLRWFPGP